jgi:Prolyl oligopeptidase family
MSPFDYADKIKTPLLMIHGEADNNQGTFPLQSERLFNAIKGHGGTVRFVLLPFEAHGYAAKENILHMLWEQHQWLEKYVKNAPQTPTMQLSVANNAEKKQVTVTTNDLMVAGTKNPSPLYILDGKEIPEEAFSKIDQNEIESVNVVKDESARKKYGEKGKYGVVEIKLKKK